MCYYTFWKIVPVYCCWLFYVFVYWISQYFCWCTHWEWTKLVFCCCTDSNVCKCVHLLWDLHQLCWWGAGVVICLERCADLHMAQLMPLPLTASCFSKIQIGFTFLVPAHLGSPGQRAVKRVCVCVNYSCGTWFAYKHDHFEYKTTGICCQYCKHTYTW